MAPDGSEPGALRFSTADAHDVDALVELVQSAYRGDASRKGWTTEADVLEGQRVDADMVRASLDDESTVILVARAGPELVACCELTLHDDGTTAHLGMFAVRPSLAGGGVGRMVLDEAERIVAEHWGADVLEIEVISLRRELIAWYERRGFRRTGDTSPFPYGDERFGVPLRDDLEFATLVKSLRPSA